MVEVEISGTLHRHSGLLNFLEDIYLDIFHLTTEGYVFFWIFSAINTKIFSA